MKLTSKLTPEELRRFLLHLDDWKKENHFPEFCDDVLAMLGQERKQLLSGQWNWKNRILSSSCPKKFFVLISVD